MKTRNVVLALVVLAFVGSLRSFGLTYEFTETSNTMTMELEVGFKIYVGGQQQYSGLQSVGNNDYKMYWDVDPIQMKTAYTGLKTSQISDASGSNNLVLKHFDGGFGGSQQWITDWSYPYTTNLANIEFSDASRIGDYTIDPYLNFNIMDNGGEPVSTTGNANMKGTFQFNFGGETHTVNIDTDLYNEGLSSYGWRSSSAYFGDDNYPQNLSLSINLLWAGWAKNDINLKCFDTTIDGHNVEVYLNSVSGYLFHNYIDPSDDFKYDTWNGTLVPEPATLSLLTFGLISLIKRKRK